MGTNLGLVALIALSTAVVWLLSKWWQASGELGEANAKADILEQMRKSTYAKLEKSRELSAELYGAAVNVFDWDAAAKSPKLRNADREAMYWAIKRYSEESHNA